MSTAFYDTMGNVGLPPEPAKGLFLLARRSSVRAALTAQRGCHSLLPQFGKAEPLDPMFASRIRKHFGVLL